jgi:hypothetical protein
MPANTDCGCVFGPDNNDTQCIGPLISTNHCTYHIMQYHYKDLPSFLPDAIKNYPAEMREFLRMYPELGLEL